MTTMLPQNATDLERAIEAAIARDLPVPVRSLWDVDSCPDNVIPWLGWALHVDGWDEGASVAQKREAIRESVRLHRKKGTPWALKRALATLGIDVDVFDQQAQRAVYAELDPNRIDGTWKLDGSHKIQPLELSAMLPQIQHWAQFIVRVNLTSVTRDAMFSRLVALVEEWKPVRSWPMFLFWLAFVLDVTIRTESSLLLDKRINQRYPWCGRVIGDADDVRWSLGRDGTTVTLSQPFGSFRIGEKRGAVSTWRLKGCRVTSTALMQSAASAPAYRLPKLSEADRRLDGTWRVGGRGLDTDSHADITSSSTIALPHTVEITHHEAIRLDYPATPAKLGGHARLSPWRRLDGRWSVGETTVPRPFGFALRREGGVLAESETVISSSADAWAMPEKLARPIATKLGAVPRRLDGRWYVGAENRLGRFRLDGRRLRAMKLTTCPRIGQFSVAPDLPGANSYDRSPGRRLHLDGSWRIGGAAAPTFNLTIIKETSHG